MSGYTRYLLRMLPTRRWVFPGFGSVSLADLRPSSRLLWPPGDSPLERMVRDLESHVREVARFRQAIFDGPPTARWGREEARPKAGQLGGKGQEDERYRFSVDVAGFAPEELTVALDGRKVTVTARRQRESESEDGYWQERQELRRETILPDNVDLQGLSCSLTSDGQLCVEGPRLASPSVEQAIPIEVKPAAQETLGTRGEDKESGEKQ